MRLHTHTTHTYIFQVYKEAVTNVQNIGLFIGLPTVWY